MEEPSQEQVEVVDRIFSIRNERVMLDFDLADIYGIPTKVLKQAVRRNHNRFPSDFMFELSEDEWNVLRSQFVTSSWGGIRYLPMAFTEQGVAMLASVLRSEVAAQANIAIIRSFVKMRRHLSRQEIMAREIEILKAHVDKHGSEIDALFDYLEAQIDRNEEPRVLIGFRREDSEN